MVSLLDRVPRVKRKVYNEQRAGRAQVGVWQGVDSYSLAMSWLRPSLSVRVQVVRAPPRPAAFSRILALVFLRLAVNETV